MDPSSEEENWKHYPPGYGPLGLIETTLVRVDLGDLTKLIPLEPFSTRTLSIMTSSDLTIFMFEQSKPEKGVLEGHD